VSDFVTQARRKNIKDPEYATLLPQELRLQLTTICNLRCKHCFQWNSQGYYGNNDIKSKINYELPFSTLEKIINQTYESKTSIYLWGGEPLMYSRWDSLSSILEKDDRPKIISTNGIYIDNKISTINKMSNNLGVVFSLDGLCNEHEQLRGRGSFFKIIKNLKLLINEKEEGRFKGEIIINCSIHNALVPKLHEFVEFCNTLKISKLILGFPWYINENTCKIMDEYYNNYFIRSSFRCPRPSWYSFNYHLDYSLFKTLVKEINIIKTKEFKLNIRFHPDLKNNLKSIIQGNLFEKKDKLKCYATHSRLSVWANGDISFCGDFPEFCCGNIINKDIKTVWNTEEFNRTRRIFNTFPRPSSLCQRCRFLLNNLI
jgi:radical SAM protein with 4Fe4S-binding SPASM domain